MDPKFVGTPPHVEIDGGIVFVTFAGEVAPRFACPIGVVRQFSQIALLRICDWEQAERSRKTVVRLHRRMEPPPPG